MWEELTIFLRTLGVPKNFPLNGRGMLVLTKLIAPYAKSLSQEIVWMDDEPSFIVESMRNEDLLKLKYYYFLFILLT